VRDIMDQNTTAVLVCLIVLEVLTLVLTGILVGLYVGQRNKTDAAVERAVGMEAQLASANAEAASYKTRLEAAEKVIEVLKKTPEEVIHDAETSHPAAGGGGTHPV